MPDSLRQILRLKRRFTVVGIWDDDEEDVFVAWYWAFDWKDAVGQAREEYGEDPVIIEVFAGWQRGLYVEKELEETIPTE